MKLFELLFAVIEQNVPMERESFAQMKKEMRQDTSEWTHDDSNKLKSLYAKYNDKWGVRLICALSYIPINKWVQRFSIAENIEMNYEHEEEF